ncbi:lipopolysaccharide biosynthesis protein [Serratia fonticola]|uniref:glycosyltransferase n=1 Tax=Serratia fonticola TaxID=47917 RepID=UPI0003F5BE57|nr:glycosyltransferase [Serratia fonticola]AKG68949.1 lipopolysaccharide biosynthesis protein [Serratia fonticola]CAI1987369.1 Glycogen synthase [Serratia fonticola]
MKRLHVINLEKMGGAEKIFLQFLTNATSGSDSVLCISNKIGPEIARELGNTPLTFANRIIPNSKLKYPVFLRKAALLRKIERQRADLVIFWDFVPNLARKICGSKTIYYDHGCSWRFPLNRKTLGFFEKVDGCIAVSHASKRVMEERFKLTCPIEIVSNCVPPPATVIAKTAEPTQCIQLGTASRLVSLKGIGISILTLQALLQMNITTELYIAGKGPDENALQELVARLGLQQQVHFLGFQQDLTAFFSKIDFYISSPVTEPFGLSCMEALYHGVPVIFPLIDGQPEVIINGECGIGITPTLTFAQYQALTGIEIDFPHQVFNTVTQQMMDPLVLSPELCAQQIADILAQRHYLTLSQNALQHAHSHFDYAQFVQTLERSFACFVK